MTSKEHGVRAAYDDVADLYAERDLLVQVDGMGEIDVVTGRIMEALASRGITGS